MKKIKVGIVNYLNTKPLLYGIINSPVMDSIQLFQDHPANIASLLVNNKIDIGLVPVAILPELPEYKIYTDYCIGCDGPVASVCLFSDVPMDEIETVLIDYQSRTSAALVKILIREYWKITPRFVNTQSEYRASIKGNTAGLVIGDRSFEQRKRSTFVYDLGEAWKQYTGLPFVFAAWTGTKTLNEQFVESFNQANCFGVQNISNILKDTPVTTFNIAEYFTRYISYDLDSEKQKGLNKFLAYLNRQLTDSFNHSSL